MDIASLGIRIDSSQAKEAVSSLDKLASIGEKVQRSMAATENSNSKMAKSLSEGEKAVAKNTRSIDQFVKALQVTAATTGMTARETILYRLALEGATAAQLEAADSAFKLNEAYQRGADIGNRIRTGFLSLATVATTGLIATAVAIDQLIKKAGDLQDIAEKTGDTAENMGSLALAAGTAGVSMDKVADFTVKLAKNLNGVDDDSKAAGAAIKALGLNLDEFKQLSAADQVEQLGRALNTFPDSSEKVAAIEALARGSSDLLPFLKEIGTEGARQVILTQEQIEQADEYADKQARVRAQLGLTAQSIATQLLPTMQQYSDFLADIAKDQEFAATASSVLQGAMSGLTIVFQTVAKVATDVGFVLTSVGREIGAIAAQITALATLDFAGFSAISEAVKEDGARARAELDRFQSRLMEIGKTTSIATAVASDYSNEGRGNVRKLNFTGAQPKDKKKKDNAAQLVKAQLALDIEDIRKDLQELISINANAEKILEAQRNAGLISEKDYYDSKRAFLQQNTADQEAALQAELARLKEDKVSGPAELDRKRKMVDVEAKLAVLRNNSATALRLLDMQQVSSSKGVERAYEEAQLAAENYLESVIKGYERTLSVLGRGDLARAQVQGRNQIEDRYAAQAKDIEDKKALEKDRSPESLARYDRQLELIAEFRKKALDEWDGYYKRLKELEGDWSQGASRAIENYLDSAGNMAKQTEDLLTNAFKGAEDALTSFVTTGKADFSNLAQSILADLARIQIKKAIASATESAGGTDLVQSALKFFSFDGGGYTGSGSRSGGIDGKGGFISILHPQETVVDHTKGQSAGGGGNISISVSVDASGTTTDGDGEQAKQLGAMVGNAVRAIIIQEKRNGGLLAA